MEEYLSSVPEWGEDERMRVQFGTFRDSQGDPDLSLQFRFWRRVLREATDRGVLGEHVLCLEAEGLDLKFERKGKTPQDLAAVLV